MADIQDKINSILNNPDALRRVQSLGEQLGLSAPEKSSEKPKTPPPNENAASADMMNLITKIAPILNSSGSSDDTANLLRALRPFLCPQRRQKLDKAEKMLRMLRMLPILRENGFF